jgi:predicted DNA-binding transcriptional regulator AlpA
VNVTKTKEVAGPMRLLSVQEVGELLQVPVATLYQWRLRREEPPGLRVGRYLRYDPADLRQWIDGQKAC